MGCSLAGALLLSVPTSWFSDGDVLDIPLRGIYVPGWKGVNRERIDKVMAFLEQNQLNALMIDVKNAHGELFYPPVSALAKEIGAQVSTKGGHTRSLDMKYLLQKARKNNVRLIARHVVFADRILYENRPEMRLVKGKSKWWVDMGNHLVVDYNKDLINQEIDMGFDEIVLDYIRYPDIPGFGTEDQRSDTIDEVVRSFKAILKNDRGELGVQVFGYSAWNHHFSNVGQRIETLQYHADIIYLLLYPSHFFAGSLGFVDPNAHPYEIIRQGYQAARSKIETRCRIIPMIQGFSYSSDDIMQQIMAVNEYKMPGFVSWHPSGDHSRLANALKKIHSS